MADEVRVYYTKPPKGFTWLASILGHCTQAKMQRVGCALGLSYDEQKARVTCFRQSEDRYMYCIRNH